MHTLITYDVSTVTPAGQKRLRKIAKVCLDYGQRVQNSVFECKVDPGQFVELKNKLLTLMKPEEDSIRFYNLGANWQGRVEHYGQKEPYDPDGPLIV
jgi:CRISPR-associated protein Cas2